MTTQTEALKLALEAAYLAGFNASGEGYNGEYPFGDKMQDPAENRVWKKDRDNYIKEALAQPQQELVAWMSEHRFDELRKGFTVMTTLTKQRAFEDDVALYTTPPQRKWVGLTDEDDIDWEEGGNLKDLVKAIEAKLKEKNT